MVRTVTLRELKCLETEDFFGPDECRLEISVDSSLDRTMRRTLGRGESWLLNRFFNFQDRVEVRLIEEDLTGSKSELGEVTIESEITPIGTALFRKGGGNYVLQYRVEEASEPELPADPMAAAEHAIEEFRRLTGGGCWPNIPREALAADMLDRVRNPYNVNQRRAPFCGPGAVVFELVRRDPLGYVQICRSLYEDGFFNSRTKEVRPRNSLLRSRVGGGMSVADWMLVATLRDVESPLFPVEGEDQSTLMAQIAGITTPREMKGWTSELLGFGDVDFDLTFLFGEFDAMRNSHGAFRLGGVAFLLVNSAMVGNDAPLVGYPDHWVSYDGELQIDDGIWSIGSTGHVRFSCYTWGSRKSVDVAEEPFEDWMWGVVIGLP
jgi:hypothetical protein